VRFAYLHGSFSYYATWKSIPQITCDSTNVILLLIFIQMCLVFDHLCDKCVLYICALDPWRCQSYAANPLVCRKTIIERSLSARNVSYHTNHGTSVGRQLFHEYFHGTPWVRCAQLWSVDTNHGTCHADLSRPEHHVTE
jgi:hypothetical protein